MTAAISAQHLSRRFGRRVAVDDLSFEVQPGEIFGFLGPNGAGKSTSIAMLAGVLAPTGGRVMLLGQPMHERALELKRRIGVVGEHQALYGDMTAERYLRFFAELYEVGRPDARIGELLTAVDLADRRRSRVNELSRGMQQKLGLARALLHDPEILVMDEPTAGLDPAGISQVRALIREQKRQGKTVFLSSHILSEIEQTADRVAIIARGRLVQLGSMSEIRARLLPKARFTLEFEGDGAKIRRSLATLPAVALIEARGAELLLTTTGEGDPRSAISRAVAAAGGTVLSLAREDLTLEQAFLRITEQTVGLLR